LFGACAILSGAAAYYFGVWPAPLLLSLWQTTAPAETATTTPAGTAPPARRFRSRFATVLARTCRSILSGIGTVQAYNTVNVQSRIDGEIMQIAFEEGQDVKQGDVLAIIDPRPCRRSWSSRSPFRKKDQALLDGAILDMKRYDTLILKDFATRQQVDQQHALVDQYRPRWSMTSAD